MDGKIIKLIEPVTTYERTFSEIVLREPCGELFARLGQPRIPVTNFAAGSGYFVDREDAIKEYLLALMDVGVDKEAAFLTPYAEGILKKLCLADALALRGALFDFFDLAGQKIAEKQRESSASA